MCVWLRPFTFSLQHDFVGLLRELGKSSSSHSTAGRTKRSRVQPLSLCPDRHRESTYSTDLWAEGLLINSPLTSKSGRVTWGQEGLIRVPGLTAPASQHESPPVRVRAVSSSSPSSASAQSGNNRSTFRQRTSEWRDLPEYRGHFDPLYKIRRSLRGGVGNYYT